MFTVTIGEKQIHTSRANLLDVLRANEIFIDTPCGGRGTCGKCTVYIDGKKALTCHTTVDRNMTVTLPPTADSVIEKCGRRRLNVSYSHSGYALAFDIGTTTVAGYLVDLSDGDILRTTTQINLQKAYGADVMSRIEYCLKHETNELSSIINLQIEDMSHKLADSLEIKKTVISANTAMSHIYMNDDVSGLAQTPFCPSFLDLQIKGNTVIMPCISAYIGGDIVSSILACDMDTEKRTVIMIDLGTNSETVLHHNGKYYCCSASAGPALEGAGISCGMGSDDGAICSFELSGGIPSFKTINSKSPVGICGSGLIDIVASFVKNGVIDKFGTFADKRTLSPAVRKYLSDKGFMISGGVYVNQQDIREFQTVKSAVHSGIEMLLDKAGINADDVSEVYLCGGLGSNINAENACRTGLIPYEFLSRTTVCGNTSGCGAVAAACDDSVLDCAEQIRKKAIVTELGGDEKFERLFISNLNFHLYNDK